MSNLDFNSFSKKYSLVISDLEKRITNKSSKAKLAQALYSDSINKKINMDELMMDVRMFYQGNVLSQVKLDKYVKRYK